MRKDNKESGKKFLSWWGGFTRTVGNAGFSTTDQPESIEADFKSRDVRDKITQSKTLAALSNFSSQQRA